MHEAVICNLYRPTLGCRARANESDLLAKDLYLGRLRWISRRRALSDAQNLRLAKQLDGLQIIGQDC